MKKVSPSKTPEAQAAYRLANADKIKASQKAYREKNKAKIYANVKAWRMANPEYAREYARKWHSRNRGKKAKWGKTYYERTKDKAKARHRKYYLANKEKVKQQVNLWRSRPENRQKLLDGKKRSYYRDPELQKAKRREYQRRHRINHPEYFVAKRPRVREWHKKQAAIVTDCYARNKLAQHSPLSAKDFPQELVELKKLEIKLKRELKTK